MSEGSTLRRGVLGPVRSRGTGLVLLSVIALLGCASERSEDERRRLRLGQQVEASARFLASNPDTLARLERLDEEHVFGHDGLAFSRRKQRVLWDLPLMRSIAPASERVLASPQEMDGRGPLQTLAHTARQLEALGIDFLVVPVPPRAAVFPDWLPDEVDTEAVSSGPPWIDLGLRELYLRLEEAGVEVLDLLPQFFEEREREHVGEVPEDLAHDRELVFRRQDVHWSSYGSRLAAAAVAQRIRRYPWWPELEQQMGRAQLVERTVWRREHGSIVASMIRRGQLQPDEAPIEVFARHDVRIRGERWSVYDPTSPIVLLGDSFSRPEHSFPQHLLAELGFRVDVLAVPLGNQSAQLGRLARNRDVASKRLVVWQIAAPAFVGQKKWRARSLVSDDPSSEESSARVPSPETAK